MLLLDADAVCKLANWRLLNELPHLVGIAPENMMAVSSLIYRAKKSIDKLDTRLFVEAEAARIAVEFLQQTAPLPEAPADLLAVFQDVADIDVGEAILFSVLLQYSEYKVLTGDKRALRALANVPDDVRKALAGRVICLEQIIVKALAVNGLDRLREWICPHKSIDGSIAIVMGSRCDADQVAVEEGLNSFVGEISSLYDPDILSSAI